VKTRLAGWLGAERAASLYEAFVRDLAGTLAAEPAGLRIASDMPDAWRDLSAPVTLQLGGVWESG
jgi:hypothetical protein